MRTKSRSAFERHITCINGLPTTSTSTCHVNCAVATANTTTPAVAPNRLVGLVVKASDSRTEDLVFESRLRRDFSGSSHISKLKAGTPLANSYPPRRLG